MALLKWVFFFALIGLTQAASARRRPLNKAEQLMLQDLKQDSTSKRALIKPSYFGTRGQLKKPRCFFEHFTASCCIQMKYRTPMVNGSNNEKDFKPRFHKACIEVGLNLTQLKVFMRAYYDTLKLTGEKDTYDLIERKKYLGKLCWYLPEPISSLELCIWLYHLDIRPEVPSAEFCLAFVVTEMLKIQFDCLHWEKGEFSMVYSRDLPEQDKGFLTVRVGQNGFRFEIKNKFYKQALATLTQVWKVAKKLFIKNKDHEKFLTAPADNSDLEKN